MAGWIETTYMHNIYIYMILIYIIYIYIYAYDMHSSYEFVARTAWDWHVWPIRSVVIEKGMNAIREIITIHIYIYII